MQSHLSKYNTYRENLLRAASASRWRLESTQHHEKSPWDEALFTDFLYKNSGKKKLLISISGVHGTEGYIGSDIQRGILQSPFITQDSEFDVLIIHAVNPYGMSWYCRTNSSNVDLNRNANQSFAKKNPDYKIFLPWIQAKSPFQRKLAMLGMLPAFLLKGFDSLQRTLAIGQFEFPEALFYGGTKLQSELQSVFDFLKKHCSHYESMFVLDIHTGLGEFQRESLIVDGHREDEAKILEKILLAKIIDPRAEKNFYVCHGQLSDGFRGIFPSEKINYIYQEFGTRPPTEIMNSLINRTQALVMRETFSNSLAEKMLHCFYPAEPEWREFCTRSGIERFRQIYLSH